MKNLLVLLFLLLCCSAESKVFKWVDENGRVHYSDKPPPDAQPSEALDIPSNSQSRVISQQTPNEVSRRRAKTPSEKLRLQKLFEQEKYAQLEAQLSAFHEIELSDIDAEKYLYQAYQAFDFPSTHQQAKLESWVAKFPNSAIGHLARGSYFFHQGWRARGTKYARETSRAQFAAMRSYFDKATQDFEKAISLNRQTILPHGFLIQMRLTEADNVESRVILDAALEVNPNSYLVRRIFMRSLEPRWGGSIAQMEHFAEESQRWVRGNHKLKLLHGFADIERGRLLYRKKDYLRAEQKFNKGLRFGENPHGLFWRGKNYYYQKLYQKALTDFDRAIALYDDNDDFYYWRSKTLARLKYYNAALQNIRRADALNPGDSAIEKHRDWLMSNVKIPGVKKVEKDESDLAISRLDQAIKQDPTDSVNYFEKAKLLLAKNETDEAVKLIKKAINLKPTRYAYYHLLDYTLVKKAKFDEIIFYWQRYIALVPDDSRAYLERAGTYYHKNDYQSAKQDARKALDLGNENARKFYDYLTTLTD